MLLVLSISFNLINLREQYITPSMEKEEPPKGLHRLLLYTSLFQVRRWAPAYIDVIRMSGQMTIPGISNNKERLTAFIHWHGVLRASLISQPRFCFKLFLWRRFHPLWTVSSAPTHFPTRLALGANPWEGPTFLWRLCVLCVPGA